MRTRVLHVFVVFVALAGLTILAAAQYENNNGNNKSQSKNSANSVTATGCLAKGNEANEYELTTPEGKKYALMAPGKVDLSKHVGHKVEVTGTPAAEKKEKGESAASEAAEGQHLRVRNLKHISDTCP